jgi:proline dehydrogenase
MAATPLAHRILARSLGGVPRPIVERLARRYVAGPSFDDAVAATRSLERQGRLVTYDVLAEERKEIDEARGLAAEYQAVVRSTACNRLSATLSIRMTGLGLRRDTTQCEALLDRVVRSAADVGVDVTIDMEDSSTTSATLAAYRRLREQGLDNVGIVLQSYLRRTRNDVQALVDLAPRVRVVKGVWTEPYELAFDDREIIRSNYLRIVARLLAAGSYLELATHDEWLLEEALELVRNAGRDPSHYECQMLFGVRPDLAELLVREGHRVRIYVPYGRDWYPYCLRRVRESPQIMRHVLAEVRRDRPLSIKTPAEFENSLPEPS